ncbi:hypothetical protein BDQ17DRAFT_1430440 [Cyathus striatus]|nr:hypothetical protein BDQ17DRAFT_1430440 [Cyathus striatus]
MPSKHLNSSTSATLTNTSHIGTSGLDLLSHMCQLAADHDLFLLDDATPPITQHFTSGENTESDIEAESPIPEKRRPGCLKKNTSLTTAETSDTHTKTADNKITYSLALFSLKELAKPKGKYFQDQLKIQIMNMLFKDKTGDIPTSNYRVLYHIRSVVPNSIPLMNEEDYRSLLDFTKGKQIGTFYNVQITINQQVSIDKDKEDKGARKLDKKKRKKKRKKTKVEIKSQELNRNYAMNENIRALRAHWECNAAGCFGPHCFVPPDGGKHIRLTNQHFEKWAAAILHSIGKEVPTAMLDIPPNHHLFDEVTIKAAPSSLLQARLNAAAKEKSVAAAPASQGLPVINFVLPNDMFSALCNIPQIAEQSTQHPSHAPAMPQTQVVTTTT